jgi:hypothetical protein
MTPEQWLEQNSIWCETFKCRMSRTQCKTTRSDIKLLRVRYYGEEEVVQSQYDPCKKCRYCDEPVKPKRTRVVPFTGSRRYDEEIPPVY